MNISTSMPARFLIYLMVASLCYLGPLPIAQAGIVGTQALIHMEQREERLERINATLLREDVQREMLALGVSHEEVEGRLASVTDEELRQIEGQLDRLPAGGSVVAAIGVVFIVLIILELVGVTNIFTRL